MLRSLLSWTNHIDRSAVAITATPAALGGMPTAELKTPWLDGIARGASAGYTLSLEWEQRPTGTAGMPGGDVTDLVALLGINWRTFWIADLRWWNSGGSWSSFAGQVTAGWSLSSFGYQWPTGVLRNIFLPLPGPTVARYWRLDLTLSEAAEGSSYPWEARRLWSGPATRFGIREGMEIAYRGTQASVISDTAIPAVGAGTTYRVLRFAGRALHEHDIHPPVGLAFVPTLQQLAYDRGVDSEAILVPSYRGALSIGQPLITAAVQAEAIYGRIVGQVSLTRAKGSRYHLAAEIQEVPTPLPSPLAPPA